MVPKLHQKGSSFRGAALYLLHDKGRAKTSERVAWTQTRNLVVSNPDTAWRIMAATALDQNRLKENAGIKSTGRKSDKSVLHLTLSWHPDDAKALTIQEMKRAASGAIEALGAKQHQAMIIAHNDEAHPHIHVLINRIHPVDGRMLSSSKEKLNLSEWAERYERERGKIYCEERVKNNEARSRGEFVRGAEALDRKAFEALQRGLHPANQNTDLIRLAKRRKREGDRILARRSRAIRERQAKEWKAFEGQYKADREKLSASIATAHDKHIESIRAQHQPSWRDLSRRHKTEHAAFKEQEHSLFGKFKNAREAATLSAHIHDKDYTARIADLFGIVTKQSSREALFTKRQKAELKLLALHQRKIEDKTHMRLKSVGEYLAQRMRRKFLNERGALIEAHKQQKALIRHEWRERNVALKRGIEVGDKLSEKEKLKQRIKKRLRSGRNKGLDRNGR